MLRKPTNYGVKYEELMYKYIDYRTYLFMDQEWYFYWMVLRMNEVYMENNTKRMSYGIKEGENG